MYPLHRVQTIKNETDSLTIAGTPADSPEIFPGVLPHPDGEVPAGGFREDPPDRGTDGAGRIAK
jgi:hypothetical protein